MRKREKGKDVANPGYFSTTLNNSLQMEGTTTRRAGLMRYTFPTTAMKKQKAKHPHVVFDWTNDLPGSFRGGQMTIDPMKGRIMMNGTFGSSFASSLFSYNSYACFDLLADGQQEIGTFGLFSGDRFGQDTKLPNVTFAEQERNTIGGQPAQRGALISWKKAMKKGKVCRRLQTKRVAQANQKTFTLSRLFVDALYSQDQQILVRFGVSYVSTEQACQNAEEEIPHYDFDAVVAQSKKLWNEKYVRGNGGGKD